MPSFQIKNRRYVLLTYAQCPPDFDYWAIVDLCSGHGAECVVGRELHKDGGIHYHVFIDFGRLFSSRKTDVFDVGGRHPNILPIGRSPGKAYDYAIKEMGPGVGCVAGGLTRPGGTSDYAPDSFWDTAQNSQSPDEFLHLCDQLAPGDFVRSFSNYRSYANWKFGIQPQPFSLEPGSWIDTSETPRLDQWVSAASLGSGPLRKR